MTNCNASKIPKLEPTDSSLLQQGVTCWRTCLASRATLLVDGDEYFRALRAAFLQARQQILITGWDFDSRILLPRGANEPHDQESAPEELGELLGFLRRTRPDLEIHVVRWDYHWFYSDDREANTRARLQSMGVRFHEDASHPVTGCVHHKVVVIDGALAFCGGIDLTHQRWDTCEHDPGNLLRRDVECEPYVPVHDTQLCVSGPIARDLADYLTETWPAPETPARLSTTNELWPHDLRVEFRDARIGIARTLPAIGSRKTTREIESFYLAAINAVERSLYLENQYFTNPRMAQALANRCRAEPQLEGLLVGMDRPKTQAELHTMGYGRTTFCNILRRAGVFGRVPLVAAMSGAVGINLHSKLAVFDDRWLTVGSANLNRRSMGFDVECNLIIEATTPAHRLMIEKLRNRLLAEHLDMSIEEVTAALVEHGMSRLPDLPQRSRRLVRLDSQPQALEPNLGPLLAPIFDPEEPLLVTQAQPTPLRSSRWVGGLLLLSLIAAAALTGGVVGEELSSLTTLQQMLASFLRG
jgi:phospholipase D1/2